MIANILIVEDEREIAELIALYLKQEGMESRICESAEEAREMFAASRYDLVVLDINLPGMDGFEFLQRLRFESKVPVVIVSARTADEDTVLGLGIGADDFITKPFQPKILVARIRANLRRHLEFSSDGRRVIRFGPFSLDAEGYYLERDGDRVRMAGKEMGVLCFLAKHAGDCKTPEEIYDEVWGNRYGDVTTVAVHIQRIRRKIEPDHSSPTYIQTIPGMGYRFNADTIGRPE